MKIKKRFWHEHVLFLVARLVNNSNFARRPFGQAVYQMIHRYISFRVDSEIASASPTNITSKVLGSDTKDSICWVFWDNGLESAPRIVQECVRSIQSNSGFERVVVLNKTNIKDYVEIDPIIYEKLEGGAITKTHFSDILRMAILAQQGGYWVDATVLFSKQFSNITNVGGNDFFTVRQKDSLGFNVAKGRWTGFFIGGESFRPIAEYCYAAFIRYWSNNDYMINYFLIDYVLDIAFKKNIGGFQQLLEAISYTNPNMFKLSSKLNQTLSVAELSSLTANTQCFKLSYKVSIREENYRMLETMLING